MWAQIPNLFLGLWLMVAPSILGIQDSCADSDRIAGFLAAALAIISSWEVTRSLRWINVGIGAWLFLAPVVLGFLTVYPLAALNDLSVAVLLATSAFRKGKIIKRYGGGWAALAK